MESVIEETPARRDGGEGRSPALPSGKELVAGRHPALIVPPPPPARDEQLESTTSWGFRDSAFTLRADRTVTMTGSRYQLSGLELTSLVPWVEEQVEVAVDPADQRPDRAAAPVPAPRTNSAFVDELCDLLPPDAISADGETRRRRGHGHALEEMHAVRYGELGRVPDLVVFPGEEQHVEALLQLAERHGVCLVPYGGGTNVSGALRCREDEDRMIVAVDMSRMNRILWIDPTNHMACIQAGAVGRDIAAQLADYGYTLGHEPDSLEFSTLGGWIATNASGMKKNRYGNIEELVLDVNVVTPRGVIAHEGAMPRESIGIDPRRWVFGSEGTLGIVTHATVKVFPLPQAQEYDAIIFPDFGSGVAFMYDLTRAGAAPASVRLMDNQQFQLGQMLKPEATGLAALKRRLEKLYVTRLRGFDVDRMTACTLVYEGTREEVRAQKAVARRLGKRHGGLGGGAANGERGYQLTFSIAYLRDFVLQHWIMGESFETSVPWSRAAELCDNVKRRIDDEHRRRALPGRPFVSCRVTQVYETGVCIYFYCALPYKGVEEPHAVFAELEHAARDEILASGGSLSHHHGIGKLRGRYLPQVLSAGGLECAAALKQAIDPADVFGIGNQQPSPSTPARA